VAAEENQQAADQRQYRKHEQPGRGEPVASLTQPIRYGPPNPARLPIELISAMAPAAADPESHAVGNVQNTAKVQKMPIAATTSATIVA
jgi:hypothetical protein